MNLCRDCVHFRPIVTYYPSQFGIGRSVNYADATCARTDVVCGTGEGGAACKWERSDSNGCGPDAKHFEAKPVVAPPEPEPPKPRCWWQWWRA